MPEYRISASLEGHGSDVRAVAFPDPTAVLTASRDGTTRLWKLTSSSPPAFDYSEMSTGATFKTCVTYIQPSKDQPDGLVISAGQDTIIEARRPGNTSGDNAEAMMVGHSNQVCSLDVTPDGRYILSGGWDSAAKIWQTGKWEPVLDLPGHTATVWAVLAFDNKTIITGCADQGIRIFEANGKLIRSFNGKGIVRALAKLHDEHPSGGQFASAGNDGVIRIWTLQGQELAQLHGHESFIYSIASLPSGEIVSAGEDRTARVWNGTTCVQTITHPAISVWSVAVCPKSGDIVTGASDNVARVFSREESRLAEASVITKFEESVRASAIPREQVGEIKDTDLPGPEFLQTKSGTKEGQVQVIKESDGSKGAYQWSTATQTWISVGTVVDSVGSGGQKKTLNGKEYDFVFDVDIEDGKPPLKLGYNVNQNPYQAAEKFLVDNELPGSYLQQTAEFIMQQTQGTTFGQSSSAQPTGSDPWGQENRYRPGEQSAHSSQPSQKASSAPKKLPQREYLPIAIGKVSAASNRIKDLNQKYAEEKSPFALSDSDLNTLSQLSQQLSTFDFNGKSVLRSTPALKTSIPILFRLAKTWEPLPNRLAPLDLLRFLAAGSPEVLQPNDPSPLTSILSSAIFSPPTLTHSPKLALTTIRLLSNLLCSESGRRALESSTSTSATATSSTSTFDLTLSTIRTTISTLSTIRTTISTLPSLPPTDTPNLSTALSTFLLNYAVALTDRSRSSTRPPKHDITVQALVLVEEIISLLTALKTKESSEAAYRALFAVGTLVKGLDVEGGGEGGGGEEVRQAVEIHDLGGAVVAELENRGVVGEERFGALVAEVRELLLL